MRPDMFIGASVGALVLALASTAAALAQPPDSETVPPPGEMSCASGSMSTGILDYATGAQGVQEDPAVLAQRYADQTHVTGEDGSPVVAVLAADEPARQVVALVSADGTTVGKLEYLGTASRGWLLSTVTLCSPTPQ